MAESGEPRRSKLDWLKSLRGADLTPAEFRIIVLLTSYSNADRENAHPGVERLVADSGLSTRTVQYSLKSLVAKGAIAVTQDGGNQTFKGAATVYQILTPPQRDKGAAHCTLEDEDKGAKSGSKGATERQTRVQPTAPHQVISSGYKHQRSATAADAAPAAADRAVTCAICSRTEKACRTANAKAPDPHEYTPRRERAAS
jgi:hypothetical protein